MLVYIKKHLLRSHKSCVIHVTMQSGLEKKNPMRESRFFFNTIAFEPITADTQNKKHEPENQHKMAHSVSHFKDCLLCFHLRLIVRDLN